MSDLLADVLSNLQHIARGEIELTKARLLASFLEYRKALAWLIVGAVCGVVGVQFVTVAGFLGLSHVVPQWIAATIIGACLLLLGAALIKIGLSRLTGKGTPLPIAHEKI